MHQVYQSDVDHVTWCHADIAKKDVLFLLAEMNSMLIGRADKQTGMDARQRMANGRRTALTPEF